MGVIVGVTTARAIVSAVAVDQANALATWIDVSINGRMLAFTSAAGIVTALICGLGPALWNTRVNPIDAMRERSRGIAASGARFGIAHLLVATQVALAFVLMLGALLSAVSSTSTQDLGFERGR
jgi:putative ABC transport system permease protein